MIDAVLTGIAQNGRGRVDGLEHMIGDSPLAKLQRLCPMLKRNQPVHMFVVTLIVERCVARGDIALPQNVEASEPGFGDRCQRS